MHGGEDDANWKVAFLRVGLPYNPDDFNTGSRAHYWLLVAQSRPHHARHVGIPSPLLQSGLKDGRASFNITAPCLVQ